MSHEEDKLQSDQLNKSEEGNTKTQQQQPDQGITFGNFSSKDYEDILNGVNDTAVEFLCDTFNATKCWVEEGSKATFSYLEQIDLKDAFVNNKEKDDVLINDEENEKVNDQQEKKPSSWASLFKSSSKPSTTTPLINGTITVPSETPGILSIQNEQENENKKISQNSSNVALIAMENDKRAIALAEHISQAVPNYTRHHLQLRGLINRANWCYINTTLQALLNIPAISHFYKTLKMFVNRNAQSTSTPLNDCMIQFFDEFEPINPKISMKKQTEDLRAGTAFEPRCVYDVLPVVKTTLSEKGRQEDAEEFLSFLLNGIHDELVDLKKLHQAISNTTPTILNGNGIHGNETEESEGSIGEDEEETWEQVGKKNKASTMRKAVIEESLIKHVFGGVIRSSVFQKGKKESTTLQPFFTLQLDIQDEKVWTLKDALESYFVKESLHGFTCTTTNTEVEASRRTSMEELPLIFIFHLKYFVFDRQGGCQKLHKGLDIPVQLEIPKDILSSSAKTKIPVSSRSYKLCAVVYHHGKHAAGGHYTASVHHGNPFGWVHFDDNNIKPVNVNQVLKYQQGCVPYLLFYERIQPR